MSPDWVTRSPYPPPLSPIPPGDRYLLDELRALARPSDAAVPWPDPPAVDLGRLIADYQRTTGKLLALTWRDEQYPDGGFWQVEVWHDRSFVGAPVCRSTVTPNWTWSL